MKQDTPNQQIASAVSEGWVHGGSFLGSILSGTLLGYLADLWLGTDPWLVICGIVLGSYAGFVRVWQHMKGMGDDAPRP